MRKVVLFLLALFVLVPGSRSLSAQASSSTAYKYIMVTEDTIKPDAFPEYERMQLEKIKALHAANWPRVSIVLTHTTGPASIVYHMSYYNSWAEIENDRAEMAKLGDLKKALKDISVAESHTLVNRRTFVMVYHPDISYQGDFNWAAMKYASMIRIVLHPGHGGEYKKNRDIVLAAHKGAHLPENLAIYTNFSGGRSSTYYVFRPITSLKAFDDMDAMHGDAYGKVLGDKNRQDLQAYFAASVETEEEYYLAFDHVISYTTPEWAAGHLDFWGK